MKLSIVIPILNEAQVLPRLLERLLPLRRHGVEIVFVDGGSDDGSAVLAECGGFTVLHASRGRARQMNAGALAASGDVLLFLHADTVLPSGVTQLLERALGDGSHVWGRFDVSISGRAAVLRVVAALMNQRSRLTGIATGDQAIFMIRGAYETVGGFPDQPLMEDIEMSRRLCRISRPACIAQKVVTSGRRWESRGVWRTIALMWRLRWAYWRGVSPDKLAELYR